MSAVSPSSKVVFNDKLVQRACRFCNTSLDHSFVDLGTSPLCQRHVKPEEANDMEPFFPLHAFVCQNCFLVQLDEFVSPDEIFSDDYAYFSSYSTSWLAHAKKYTDKMQEMLSLGKDNLVVELASNDGYLLQYFVEKEVPVLGIEPTANTAEAAREKGVRTEGKFFGVETAKEMSAKYGKADLLLGNNVLAHVPDINDFVGGMKIMLAEGGVITMEFPHLQRLMEENQFDTIYHEHFSYLSFTTVEKIFDHHGITLFDVEELPTHGGSIRIFGRHKNDESKPLTARALEMHAREIEMGFQDLNFYADFEERVKETKRKILEFLIEAKREGKQIVGYGAPGKGNTLLNYCGIRTDFLDYTVDRNPHKQGNFLPGTRIPIYDPEKINETKPDYIFILPWNLKTEIINQMSFVREWGCKFVVPIPELTIIE
ncbi:MAG: class I SAM-dependent methyltransferase [Bacteroidota bacterium]